MCNPPASYNGPCSAVSVGGDAAAKEKIAVQCEAGWPCENSAPLNFSGCPRGWTASAGGLCTAPSSYDGICGHTTNFSSFSKTEKAKWAMCSAQWPAGTGPSVAAYVQMTDDSAQQIDAYNNSFLASNQIVEGAVRGLTRRSKSTALKALEAPTRRSCTSARRRLLWSGSTCTSTRREAGVL